MKTKAGRKVSRLLLAVLAVVLMLGLCVVSFASVADGASAVATELQCYMPGDVNGDGTVNDRDAIYTLYHAMFTDDDKYAIYHNWDFNGDNKEDSTDAIYLLYEVLFNADQTSLCEDVHVFFDPVWVWENTDNGMSAKLSFKCACGEQSKAEVANVERTAYTAATCEEAGSASYVAKVTVDGKDYVSDTKTETLKPLQHDLKGVQNCDESASCQRDGCTYELNALGHKWTLDEAQSKAATCSDKGVQTFVCEVCPNTKTEKLDDMPDHMYELVEEQEVAVEKEKCTYQKQYLYRCSACGDTDIKEVGETYLKHSHKAAVTKEANCVETGEKTYTCACGDTYDEEIPSSTDAHQWDEGTEANGIITYRCQQNCGAVKTAVAVVSNAAVSKDVLQSAEEVALDNGASMAMDAQTLDALDETKEIKISVEQVPVADINVELSEEQKTQIGDGQIYDFNMAYDDDTPIEEFGGEITISLPYVLQDGDDVDSIGIWYIDNNGVLTPIKGTYSNGFVTFKTDHFSYYTVTRLTAKERCELYGHVNAAPVVKEATCSVAGYTLVTCERCAAEISRSTEAALGHDYQETENKPATCEEKGFIKVVCQRDNCGHTINTTLPALGHNMNVDSSSVASSCETAGKEVYVCANGCGKQVENVIPAVGHDYEQVAEKPADCEHNGYKTMTCGLCGDSYEEITEGAGGHQYMTPKAEDWQWTEDYYSATVTLVCAASAEHTKTLNAVVTETTQGSSCTVGGTTTYTAVASFNKVTYETSVVVDREAPGHQPDKDWYSDEQHHFHLCEICGMQMDVKDHSMVESEILKAPTCRDTGEALDQCSVCGYEQTRELPVTTDHQFVNDFCTVCGLDKTNCDHYRIYKTDVSMSDYNCCDGVKVYIYSCACGKDQHLRYETNNCNWSYIGSEPHYIPLYDITIDRHIYRCENCGLTEAYGSYDVFHSDCTRETICYSKLSVGETVIAETSYVDSTSYDNHYTNNTVEEIILTMEEHGLCDTLIYKDVCACGKAAYYNVDYGCQWGYIGSDEYNNQIYTCSVCGAEKIESCEMSTKEGCYTYWSCDITYNVNAEAVLTYTNRCCTTSHIGPIVDCQMSGTSCEDGAVVTIECSTCGKRLTETITDHTLYTTSYIELPEDVCGSAYITQYACACGLYGYSGIENVECMFEPHPDDSGETCYQCGMRKIWHRTRSEKDENCVVQVSNECTYYAPNGEELATLTDISQEEDHALTTVCDLVGTSCEDGVTLTSICNDCSYQYSDLVYHHASYDIIYDLSGADMCKDEWITWGCGCGRWGNADLWDLCNWEDYYDEVFGYVWACPDCNTLVVEDQVKIGKWNNDPCYDLFRHTYSFYDAEDHSLKISISVDRASENHRIYYELILAEGGSSCVDGFTANEKCKDCDFYHEYTAGAGDYDSCVTFTTDRRIIQVEGLCCDLELITSDCACGYYHSQHWNWLGDSCQYESEEYIEGVGWVAICSNCGITRVYESTSDPVAGTSCEIANTETVQFLKNGTELATITYSSKDYEHRNITTFKLEGTTCDEGFQYQYTCVDCGHQSSWFGSSGHGEFCVERTEVYSGEGICGPLEIIKCRCACGENTASYLVGDCRWSWNGYNENGAEIAQCMDCNATRIKKTSWQSVPGTCDLETSVVDQIFLNDEVIGSYLSTTVEEHHLGYYTYTLEGETCQDGYTYVYKCYFCGEVIDEGYNTECDCKPIDFIVLCDVPNICSSQVIAVESCACGELSNYCYYARNCCFSPDTSTEEGEVAICQACGLTQVVSGDSILDVDNCTQEVSNTYRFYLNDELVSEKEVVYTAEYHMSVAAYEMLGETCDDGYYVKHKCMFCDKLLNEYGPTYGCQNFETEITLVYDDDPSVCGPILFSRANCACGKASNSSITSWCNWETITSTGDETHERCVECGLEHTTYYETTTVPNSCLEQYKTTHTFIKSGDVVASFVLEDEGRSHRFICEYRMLGESCSDGYYLVDKCIYCDWVSEEHGPYYDCAMRTVDIDTLYKSDCGEFFVVTGETACGIVDISYQTGCYNWEGFYNEEYGATEHRCYNCGLSWIEIINDQHNGTDCSRTITVDLYFFRDGELIHEEHKEYQVGGHYFFFDFYDLQGDSCEDGYRATLYCKNCDFSCHWGQFYDHYQQAVEYIDLNGTGACGGMITRYDCACGRYATDFVEIRCVNVDLLSEWERIDDQGETHLMYSYICRDCGLQIVEDHSFVPTEEPCTYEQVITGVLTIEGQEISLRMTQYVQRHARTETIVEFLGENNSCTEGINEITRCLDCGREYSSHTYYHHELHATEERIDLTQYGSTCGASLVKYVCHCGKLQRYDFGEDTSCYFDEVETDNWIDGALYEWQPNTNQGTSAYSYAYIFTCAVTEPECNMKIRMAEYWLREGCEAVEYQTWQLGYDPATGTCLQEVTTPTGERRAFHDYSIYEEDYTTFENGDWRNSNKYTCADCGSIYLEQYTYSAEDSDWYDHYVYMENTLSNGDPLTSTEHEVRDYVYMGHRYQTHLRREITQSDGTLTWDDHVYTYDFSNGCNCLYTYTDSDGNNDVYDTTACILSSNYQWITEPSCAVVGIQQATSTCTVCGRIENQWINYYDPHGHQWQWDDSQQVYVCMACGLESVNDASGAITMEILQYFNSEEIIVAYWNRENLNFHPYLSFVMYDAPEGQDNEVILSGIDIQDIALDEYGNRALYISSEQALPLVNQALDEIYSSGYRGTVALRLTLVPLNSSDALDYAVTFEEVIME